MQEIKLSASAYDGDVEGVGSMLEAGVPVDVTRPVRHTSLANYLYSC